MEWVIFAAVAVGGLLLFSAIKSYRVYTGETGLLYSKLRFDRELEPGQHRIFDPFGTKTLTRVSLLSSAFNPHVYDVISKDQFAFRVTVTPLFRITDARAFNEQNPRGVNTADGYDWGPQSRFTQAEPVLAEGVLQAVADKTLEEFLADPAEAVAPIKAVLERVMPGAEIEKIAVTAVTLPPEVRKMFTEVERARREGLAGLERAKAEQTSLRALANAARNMSGNPQLAQLKMLQVMESAKGAKTFVMGNPTELPEQEKG